MHLADSHVCTCLAVSLQSEVQAGNVIARYRIIVHISIFQHSETHEIDAGTVTDAYINLGNKNLILLGQAEDKGISTVYIS